MNVQPAVGLRLGAAISQFFHARVHHVKRIVFTTTLFTHLTGSEKMEERALSKLHEVMELGRSRDALLIPSALTNVVWSQERVGDIETASCHEVTGEEAEKYCRLYIAKCPQWLRYDLREMVHDAIDALRASNLYAANAAV